MKWLTAEWLPFFPRAKCAPPLLTHCPIKGWVYKSTCHVNYTGHRQNNIGQNPTGQNLRTQKPSRQKSSTENFTGHNPGGQNSVRQIPERKSQWTEAFMKNPSEKIPVVRIPSGTLPVRKSPTKSPWTEPLQA